jgi:hypothetical protein
VSRLRPHRLAILLAASLAACAAEEGDASEDDLRNARVDLGHSAVGALVLGDRVTCTATLISADTLVTAKHCVTNDASGETLTRLNDLRFVASATVTSSATRYAIREGYVPSQGQGQGSKLEGGFIGFGSDVVILTLAEPVRGVQPLRLAKRTAIANEKLEVVGYGFDERDLNGVRKTGQLTVRSTAGQAAARVWKTLAEFSAFVARTENGLDLKDSSDDRSAQAARFYSYELLPTYEAYAGLAKGDAQPCRSDSGGPVLRGNEVVGVLSGSLKLSSTPCGNYGAFFATVPVSALPSAN